MNTLEKMEKRRKSIAEQLAKIKVVEDKSVVYIKIASNLDVTAPTIRNYLGGRITDGYLAEAILTEFKRLKYVK